MEIQALAAVTKKRCFLIINCIMLAVGICGGPLIMRVYYTHGGKRIWFNSWLETGGWPIMFIPLLYSYTRRLSTTPDAKLVVMKPRVFFSAAAIGTFTGLDDYLYAYGIAKLPVSTSSLIIATQLAFTAVFAYFLVKQKFTAYTINSVVLLTVGAVVLGLHTGGDRPAGETNKDYWMGFMLTVVAAVMYGLILPLIEFMYQKANQELTYTLIMEIQLVMSFFATLFCTVGMVVNRDFQAIGREAKAFDLGEGKYYLVVVWGAILWQCFYLGAVGAIFYSSSLLSAIIISFALPLTEVLAVFFLHEKFQSEKGVALFLSLWGFASYFFGEIKQIRKNKNKDNVGDNQTSNVQLGHQDSIP